MKNPFKKAPVLPEPTFEIKKPATVPAAAPAPEPLPQETKLDQDIRRYQDLEGLSIRNLEIGYWYVKNKQNFIYAFQAALAFIGTVTWSLFFFTYGHYIFIGMAQDKRLAEELTRPTPELAAAIRDQAARPLIVNSVQPIKNGAGDYDFAVNVTNPNQRHTVRLVYELNYGTEVLAGGEGFVLPGESKYLLVLAVPAKGSVERASFRIVGESYKRITAHEFADWEDYRRDHSRIEAANVAFTPAQHSSLTEKLGLNDLSFVAVNGTVFNYYRVDFQILLFNLNRLVGVNRIAVDRLRSGESRQVQLSWPGRLDRVSETRVVPEIDFTRPDIYFRVDYPTVGK